jgi:arsenate reductase
MVEGFLKSFDERLDIHSAGTEASGKINPQAVKAMAEIGIDISGHTSDPVEKYLEEAWDYVITVCGGANENCPAFYGDVKHRLHMGYDDPSFATGSDDFVWSEYLRVRDEIRDGFYQLYKKEILPSI